MNYIIITAANDLYINTIIDFINTFNLDYTKLIIYNVGLNSENLQQIILLKEKYGFLFKTFNFNNYPEHVDLKKYNGLNCTYAFKPVIIYNEANEETNKNKVLIWMDSANRFNINHITQIYNIVQNEGFYSPISANTNTIETIELNNHKIVKSYGLTQEEHFFKLFSISSGLVGLNYELNAGKEILDRWYNDSLNKELISPDETNRNNNRQDQTTLSIIMYLYEKNKNVSFNKNNVGVSFWNKKDKSTIDPSLQPYKLIEKQNGKQLAIIFCKNIGEAIKTYANRKDIEPRQLLENYIICN
jgi:hypothetical protein